MADHVAQPEHDEERQDEPIVETDLEGVTSNPIKVYLASLIIMVLPFAKLFTALAVLSYWHNYNVHAASHVPAHFNLHNKESVDDLLKSLVLGGIVVGTIVTTMIGLVIGAMFLFSFPERFHARVGKFTTSYYMTFLIQSVIYAIIVWKIHLPPSLLIVVYITIGMEFVGLFAVSWVLALDEMFLEHVNNQIWMLNRYIGYVEDAELAEDYDYSNYY